MASSGRGVDGAIAVGYVRVSTDVERQALNVYLMKLLGATVAHDVETLCNAESASGFALRS